MSGGPPAPSNIPYFNQYDLNAKLMELAANQQQQQQGQNQASSQQQYSFYSEIIPSPIVYTTAAPVIFSPAQFVHNHSSSPIAHFIAPPPPPPQAPPPHVQPVLPHLVCRLSYLRLSKPDQKRVLNEADSFTCIYIIGGFLSELPLKELIKYVINLGFEM